MIRRATSADHPWIRDTAADVYRPLGDYATIIPSWLEHTGVLAYVDEEEAASGRRRRGFILLGFYRPDERRRPALYVADLLAIAVAPRFQRRGLGRRLLRYAIHLALLAGREDRVTEMRLTVADTNQAGLRLFSEAGFRVLDEEHGSYEGGQRAIRMARPLG